METLAKMKPKVLRRSSFGDDHHAAIDAQIEVIKEMHDEDRIFSMFDPNSVGNGESEIAAENILSAARDARNWMDGESEDGPPSKSWKELLR
jgi:hypothetical protein